MVGSDQDIYKLFILDTTRALVQFSDSIADSVVMYMSAQALAQLAFCCDVLCIILCVKEEIHADLTIASYANT